MDYAPFILAAYATTGTVLAAMIARAWWVGRARARRLRDLGDPGER